MKFRLRVASRAEKQIREAADWWLENRRKAPRAFSEDLEKAFDLITSLPRAGEPVRHPRLSGLRRLYLQRVRYHLYYSVSDDTEIVEVLAFWHPSRGRKPTLG